MILWQFQGNTIILTSFSAATSSILLYYMWTTSDQQPGPGPGRERMKTLTANIQQVYSSCGLKVIFIVDPAYSRHVSRLKVLH